MSKEKELSKITCILVSLLLIGAGFASANSGLTTSLEQRIETSDFSQIALHGLFGDTVSIDGDLAVVGNQYESTHKGAVYVFTRIGNSWSLQQKITDSDTSGFHFGQAIAIDEESVVILGRRQFGVAILAFYSRNGSTLSHQQTVSVNLALDLAPSLDIDGDVAVAGAVSDSGGFGSIVLVKRESNTWQAAFENPFSSPNYAGFGRSVALEGETLMVGARHAADDSNLGGAVFVFSLNRDAPAGLGFVPYSQSQILLASDGSDFDEFGSSISLDGDTVIVGAERADDPEFWSGNDAGTAYVFTKNNGSWQQQTKLTASDAFPLSLFGRSVGLFGDVAVVTAPAKSVTNYKGAVYVFHRSGTGWSEEAIVETDVTRTFPQFGQALSLDGDTLLIGSDLAGGEQDGFIEFHRITVGGENNGGPSDSGISEAWQTANGFDPEVDDVFTLDSDGDGDPDIWEIFQGTDRDGPGDSYGFKQTQANSSSKTLSTQFRRSTLTEVTSVVMAVGKWSIDMQNWNDSGDTVDGVKVTFTEQPTDMGDYEIVDVDVSVTGGETPQLFYSLELVPVE